MERWSSPAGHLLAAFRSVRPEFAAIGRVVAGSVLLILSYYLVLTGWVLAFLVDALGTPTVPGGGLAVYGATLPGFRRAVGFLFRPDSSVLADSLLWSAAFGQVFFSLSEGQGIVLTYGSYLEAGTDLARSALLITVVDVGVARRRPRHLPGRLQRGLDPTLDLSIAGVGFLDRMDESVGAYALPITATPIAVVFTRYQDDDALSAQVGDSVVHRLVKYVIPVVLVALAALRLFAGSGFPWQYTGTGIDIVGRLPRAAVLVGLGVVLYLRGRFVARRLPPRFGRRREPGS